MSVTRDKNTGKWMSQIRVKDWTGKEIHKKKRGFKTKKEALQWEQDFISQADGSLGMKFKDFVALYMKDADPRLRETTLANKHYLFNKQVLPYFGEMPINVIKATDIRNWQNELIHYRRPNGKCYSPTYLRTINNQLTAAFNFAVKFYGLRENPCHKAGTMGKKNADEMLFWTKDEYLRFSEAVMDKPLSFHAFELLYWTGIRCGELLALTPSDFMLESSRLRINKSYQSLNGVDTVTDPKTPKSVRTIVMPAFLRDEMADFIEMRDDVAPDERLFAVTKHFLAHEMERGCKASGVKRIRIHDIRHSHVSLLIEMGFSALAIAERMGHEAVDITYRYAHLFPTKQDEMAAALDGARG